MDGARVGRYTLGEQLGRPGGMGAVWLATDETGRQVALKVMHAHAAEDADLVRRFRQEYEIGRRFNHPNLVKMVDQGTVDGTPFLVMELAQGKTVRRLLERGGTFREGEVARFIADAAAGLTALHAGGIIHRDLSATNLMVERDLSAKIIDYGIARHIGSQSHTQAGGFMGKAEYSAPELYLGRSVGPPADIYALGILAFESLTGHVPFRAGRYMDVLRLQAERPVPSLSAELPVISDQMDALVQAMLDKIPARRPSAADVERACRAIAAGAGASPNPLRPAPLRPQPQRPASPVERTAYRPQPSPAPTTTGTRSQYQRQPSKAPIVAAAVVGAVATAGVIGVVITALAQGG